MRIDATVSALRDLTEADARTLSAAHAEHRRALDVLAEMRSNLDRFADRVAGWVERLQRAIDHADDIRSRNQIAADYFSNLMKEIYDAGHWKSWTDADGNAHSCYVYDTQAYNDAERQYTPPHERMVKAAEVLSRIRPLQEETQAKLLRMRQTQDNLDAIRKEMECKMQFITDEAESHRDEIDRARSALEAYLSEESFSISPIR